MVVVEGATVRPFVTGITTMIILAVLGSLSAIVAIGWLAFSFAVFALPAFVGVNIGIWAYQAGTGLLVAGILGLLAAGATFLVGHLLLVFIRPIWGKLLVATTFAAPAAVAGYALTHGIVKHLIPADGWQIAFSIVGAITVAVAALMQVAGAADNGAVDRSLRRA